MKWVQPPEAVKDDERQMRLRVVCYSGRKEDERPSAQSEPAKAGLILLDPAFRIIGLDRGAAAILDGADRLAARRHFRPSVPQTILAALHHCPPDEVSSFEIPFQTGGVVYRCSVYRVESRIKGSRILALHLERCRSGLDTLDELSSEYRLTDREQEALRGIALGLTTKEVAERMNISPNTVKAFLRLIMLKMSVNTRAGITAKLLERNGWARPPATLSRKEGPWQPRHAIAECHVVV